MAVRISQAPSSGVSPTGARAGDRAGRRRLRRQVDAARRAMTCSACSAADRIGRGVVTPVKSIMPAAAAGFGGARRRRAAARRLHRRLRRPRRSCRRRRWRRHLRRAVTGRCARGPAGQAQARQPASAVCAQRPMAPQRPTGLSARTRIVFGLGAFYALWPACRGRGSRRLESAGRPPAPAPSPWPCPGCVPR